MGRIAKQLERTGEPVVLKLGNKPVGVLVSVKDFQERFVLHDAAVRRRAVLAEILSERIRPRASVDKALGELRGR